MPKSRPAYPPEFRQARFDLVRLPGFLTECRDSFSRSSFRRRSRSPQKHADSPRFNCSHRAYRRTAERPDVLQVIEADVMTATTR